MIRAGLVLALALAAGFPAGAATLDRVSAAGVLRCGAAERVGFASAGEGGRIAGLGVDLCRALTVGVLGREGRTEFHVYDLSRAGDQATLPAEDVAFLTAADLVAMPGLAARIIPGPPVFVVVLTALTQADVSELAGRTVCFMNGSAAHQALEAWAEWTHTTLVRIGFQEEGEMQDAFDAHRCDAMTGEQAELAEFRAAAPRRARTHMLGPLAAVPVFVAVSTADGDWASLAFWALGAVVQSEAAPNPWRGDMPGVTRAGLRPGWMRNVAETLGDYGAMLRRALGPGSAPGPNAPWPQGLLLPPGPR